MNEQRLIEIETKLAHQEHLLSSLDDALTRQQAQLTRLEELCRSLAAAYPVAARAGDGRADR